MRDDDAGTARAAPVDCADAAPSPAIAPMTRRARLRAAWLELPPPVRGALLMMVSAASFALMAGVIRHLADHIHPFEMAFFRNLFSLLMMAPWVLRGGFARLRTASINKYGLRGLMSIIAMLSWFYGLAMMPIAEATALSFTAPIFASIGAILFLGEHMGVRRWSAIIIGFVGAMIILRPGFHEVTWPALVVLGGSAAVAGSIIMVKILSRTEPSNVIVTYMGIYLVPMSLIPALFVWTTPSGTDWLWLAFIAGIATVGQLGITYAYATTEATVVLPFDYARLPFAAAIAYLAFDEAPDRWTWLGAAVIAGSAIYIARREAQRATQKVAATAAVTR
jgi:S-adenosylmethionine uptake transporter